MEEKTKVKVDKTVKKTTMEMKETPEIETKEDKVEAVKEVKIETPVEKKIYGKYM